LSVTDVSGRSICPIFKGQAAYQAVSMDCFTSEDGTGRFYRNVSN